MSHEVILNDKKHKYNEGSRTVHMTVQELHTTYNALQHDIILINPATGNKVQFTLEGKISLYALYSAMYSADGKEYYLVVWSSKDIMIDTIYNDRADYARTPQVVREN